MTKATDGDQHTLFPVSDGRRPRIPYRGHAPHNQSATSIAAAESIEPKKGSLQWAVWDAIRRRGAFGQTRDELEVGLGIGGNTVRPRVRELLEMGVIVESDMKRKTRSGRAAFVLVCR